ncbi:MAG TPA: hypothetical protein VKG63_11450 [Steroidobacteraceae bacterium]|nr:hypothetical protein [Steroidobacteraceae bacterium]
MKDHPSETELERLLDRTLRALPLRRAPPTLESRVLGELERRAAQPWWRRSFSHWPLFARLGFVVTAAALAGLALLGGSWPGTALQSLQVAGPASTWLQPAAAITGAAGSVAASLVNSIPQTWIDLGLGAAVVLYATLFGLGAAAYRMLYLQPQSGREFQ